MNVRRNWKARLLRLLAPKTFYPNQSNSGGRFSARCCKIVSYNSRPMVQRRSEVDLQTGADDESMVIALHVLVVVLVVVLVLVIVISASAPTLMRAENHLSPLDV